VVAGDFDSRFRDALRRRLYPRAPLHLKQIAHGIGRSENTVARWWRGETRILADDLYRLAEFFLERDDRAFLSEIFGDLVPGAALPEDLAASLLSLVRVAFAESRNGRAASRELSTWVNADGAVIPAPAGHAAYVRDALQLPGIGGDLAAYAMRVLGWIALTERDAGVTICHDGRRVAPLAAERIGIWLEDNADRIGRVKRGVLMDGLLVEGHHATASEAAMAIGRVASIVKIARRTWSVRPLPLDSIADARLNALLEAFHREPAHLVHAAAAMGAFTTSSLFGVNGDNVTSHCVGTDLGFDPRMVEGLNVLARPDTEYALMLQARVLKARREGPIYNELCGTIDAFNVRYLNLALPEAGQNGRVLTSSLVLERDLIAA
jgi:transcriptional regulator with XRE-family HTH domain